MYDYKKKKTVFHWYLGEQLNIWENEEAKTYAYTNISYELHYSLFIINAYHIQLISLLPSYHIQFLDQFYPALKCSNFPSPKQDKDVQVSLKPFLVG